MPIRYFRIGPFGFGFEPWWEEPYWIDVDRTANEVILTLKIPKYVRKEDLKVEYREGRLRIRYPRREGGWEEIPVE